MFLKPMIVMRSPSEGADPREPLSGKYGAFLAKIARISQDDFVNLFDGACLIPLRQLDEKSLIGLARERALDLLTERRLDRPRILLIGAGVTSAFDLSGMPLLKWMGSPQMQVAAFPDGDDGNLYWKHPASRAKATVFLRDLVRLAIERRERAA